MTAERTDGATRSSGLQVALLLGLAIVVLAAAAVRATAELTTAERAQEAEAAAGAVASGVGVDLGLGLHGVSLTAAAVPTAGLGALVGAPETIAPGAVDVGFVPLTEDVPVVVDQSPVTPEQRADPELASVFDRARDTGAPQLSAPVEVVAGTHPVMAAAVYGPGERPGSPVTSADRRTRLTGWVVAVVDMDTLIAEHAPDDLVVTVRDSGGPAPAADPPDGAEQQVVVVGGRQLVVEAADPSDAGTSSVALVLAGTGVALAVVAGFIVVAARRRERDAPRGRRAHVAGAVDR